MYSIYLITNKVNNFVYVGQTCKSINTRFNEHKNRAKFEPSRPLYRAFSEFGIENFKIELLEENLTKDEANLKEIFYISEYNAYIGMSPCKGYNATLGGDCGSYNAKFVVQIDLDFNVLNIFNSTHEAGRFLNVPNAHISDCCTGKRKFYQGYFWLYLEDFKYIESSDKLDLKSILLYDISDTRFKVYKQKCNKTDRVVQMKDLTTKEVITFRNKTNKEIECLTGIKASYISRCLTGKRSQVAGKTFNYIF